MRRGEPQVRTTVLLERALGDLHLNTQTQGEKHSSQHPFLYPHPQDIITPGQQSQPLSVCPTQGEKRTDVQEPQ